jgi:hypothetical protein
VRGCRVGRGGNDLDVRAALLDAIALAVDQRQAAQTGADQEPGEVGAERANPDHQGMCFCEVPLAFAPERREADLSAVARI